MVINLQPSQTVLLIIDVQEKIISSLNRSSTVLHAISTLVQGFQILNIPILLSEQYPEGLGSTVASLRGLLNSSYLPWIKSTFSCMDDSLFFNYVASIPYQQWVVVGVETHICVLQTVKGLLKSGKQVTVLSDAVTSHSVDDYLTALAEITRDGARVSSVETVLFELLKNSTHPQFKLVSQLIKSSRDHCSGLFK